MFCKHDQSKMECKLLYRGGISHKKIHDINFLIEYHIHYPTARDLLLIGDHNNIIHIRVKPEGDIEKKSFNLELKGKPLSEEWSKGYSVFVFDSVVGIVKWTGVIGGPKRKFIHLLYTTLDPHESYIKTITIGEEDTLIDNHDSRDIVVYFFEDKGYISCGRVTYSFIEKPRNDKERARMRKAKEITPENGRRATRKTPCYSGCVISDYPNEHGIHETYLNNRSGAVSLRTDKDGIKKTIMFKKQKGTNTTANEIMYYDGEKVFRMSFKTQPLLKIDHLSPFVKDQLSKQVKNIECNYEEATTPSCVIRIVNNIIKVNAIPASCDKISTLIYIFTEEKGNAFTKLGKRQRHGVVLWIIAVNKTDYIVSSAKCFRSKLFLLMMLAQKKNNPSECPIAVLPRDVLILILDYSLSGWKRPLSVAIEQDMSIEQINRNFMWGE